MSHYDEICSLERFAKDTATHEMTVLRDDGVYRHLCFKRPNSSSYRFDLVTWPGFLAITGDMGENMFSRLTDMFEFFRTDRGSGESNINAGYWMEKVQAGGRDSCEEWSATLFNKNINDLLKSHLEDCDLDEDDKAELTKCVKSELLNPEDEHHAIQALREWDNQDFYIELCDFPSDKEYTFHYIWRCRAIAWGIEQYDALKAAAVPEGEAA